MTAVTFGYRNSGLTPEPICLENMNFKEHFDGSGGLLDRSEHEGLFTLDYLP